MNEVICFECGEKMYTNPAHRSFMTLVAYYSPPGHNHDDNCRTKVAICKNGHKLKISKRNICSVEGCDWKGKTTCFCHEGNKLDEWPDKITEANSIDFWEIIDYH